MRWGKRVGDYIRPIAIDTVTARMTSAMESDESHFNILINCEGQSHKAASSTNHNLFEEKGEPKQYRHQNDSCSRWAAMRAIFYFLFLLIVRDEVTTQCPQITTFLKRKESRSGIHSRPFSLADVFDWPFQYRQMTNVFSLIAPSV